MKIMVLQSAFGMGIRQRGKGKFSGRKGQKSLLARTVFLVA